MPNSSKAFLISLNRSQIKPHQGYCYVYDLPVDAPSGDSEHDSYSSAAILFENGVALGPTHVPHDLIRGQGGGRFSHWNGQLYFSTSDNTEPHLNRRDYHLYIPAVMDSDPEWSLINRDSSKAVLISLNRSQIKPDQGYCYVYDLPVGAPSGNSEHGSYSSAAILFENSVALGPTHVPHDLIRGEGGGRFSHWNGRLY